MNMNRIGLLGKTNFTGLSLQNKINIKKLNQLLSDLNLSQIGERKAHYTTYLKRHLQYKQNNRIYAHEV